MLPTPRKFTLVAGYGEGNTTLNAFDSALLNSGLGNLNLLKVSSILPPQAKFFSKLEIPYGSLLPTAYGSICSKIPGEIISAAVAVGIPQEDTFGVIMEASGICSKKQLEQQITDMVIEAFITRNLDLKEIKVSVIEHKVIHCGAVFSGVALWY